MSTVPALLAAAAGIALVSPAPVKRLGPLLPPRSVPRANWERLKPLIPVVTGAGVLLVLLGDRLSVAVAALTATGTGVVLVRATLGRRQDLARARATATLLGHLIADLEAGADPGTALASAAEEVQSASAPEVPRLVRAAATHARRGHDPAAVLAGQDDLAELAQVGKAWGLAQRHGMALTGLLRTQREQITQRLRHEAATTASLQGPQATALILSALPLAGMLLGSGMGANPVAWLLGGGLGGTLLMAGTALNCAGLLIAHEIIRRART